MKNLVKIFNDSMNEKLAKQVEKELKEKGLFKDSQSGYLLKELTQRSAIDVETLYQKLEGLKYIAKEMFPIGTAVVQYNTYDHIAKAKVVDKFSKNFPASDVIAKENLVTPWLYAQSYEWSLIEEPTASLPALADQLSRRRMAATDAILRGLDDAASFGHSKVKGLLNQTTGANGVTRLTTADWTNPSTTTEVIQAKIAEGIRGVAEATLERFSPNVVLLPSSYYTALVSRVWSANDSRTLMSIVREQHPGVVFAPWTQLEEAGQSNKPRILIMNTEAENLSFGHVGPMLNETAPQAAGLVTTVGMYASAAGLILRRPKAMLYIDEQ